ncbi:hypothetical protein JCM5350_005198, partial [Sporobolomyces pararoseus]
MSSTPAPPEDGSEPPLAPSNPSPLAPPFPSSQQSYLSATTTTSTTPSSENDHEHHEQYSQSHSGAPSPGLSSLSTPQFSPYSTVSIPPTPAGLDGDDQDPLPQFNAMNLELSQRDQGTLHHQAHGSGSEARHLSQHVHENHE